LQAHQFYRLAVVRPQLFFRYGEYFDLSYLPSVYCSLPFWDHQRSGNTCSSTLQQDKKILKGG